MNELFCRSCLSLCPLSVGEGSSDDGYEREREREREREKCQLDNDVTIRD